MPNTARKKLSASQKSWLESAYRKTLGGIDRKDVKYALDKTMEKVQGLIHSSIDWVADLGKQATLLYKMLKDWWNDRYEVPWGTVAAITAALLYLVNPFDFFPDFIPVVGYLDDAVVIAVCFRIIRADLRRYARTREIDLKEYGL